MRVVLALIFIAGFGSLSFGQNTPRFGQINFAQGVINPAALALDGKIMADLIFRNQWMGVEGAPTTMAFNGQYEFDQRHATGLLASYDGIGVSKTTSVKGQYAYRLILQNNRAVIFGLGVGIDNVVNNYQGTVTIQEDDPVFATSFSKVYFNGSFGVYYYAPKFYAGIGIPQLFQNKHTSAEQGFQPPRFHNFVNLGWYLESSDRYTFNPHIQIKALPNAPLQADLVLRNTFNNRFSLNIGYRSEHSIIAGFDILFGGMARVGYSFNYDVARLAKIKGMSNELYLGVAFPYHNSRERWSNRKYFSKKGRHKSDYRQNSRTKHYRRNFKYNRKRRYR